MPGRIEELGIRSGRMYREDSTIVNLANILGATLTPFGQLRVTEATPIIELKSTYGTSYWRDIVTTAGSGSVTNSGGEFVVSTTANGADSARLESAELVRYVPGLAVIGGIGVRIPTDPVGSQVATWGFRDGTSGIYFGVDATGPFVALDYQGSQDIKKYQAEWNVDTLDGDGLSGLTLDLSAGLIFQPIFAWYGYGIIQWWIVTVDENGYPYQALVHQEKVNGRVSVEEPNLPLWVEIDNGGTGEALDVYVGGRQAAVLGDYHPTRRITSAIREGITGLGASFTPVISIRRKSAYAGVSVKMAGVEVLPGDDLVFRIVSGATLTTPSWGAIDGYSPGETALEVDVATTSFSGGETLRQGLISASNTGQVAGEVDLPNLDFVRQDPVTLLLKTLGATNVSAEVDLEAREEW